MASLRKSKPQEPRVASPEGQHVPVLGGRPYLALNDAWDAPFSQRTLALLGGPTPLTNLHGLMSHGAQRAAYDLTGQSGGEVGPGFQVKAGAGANRPRRALRAFTARVAQKPTTEAA